MTVCSSWTYLAALLLLIPGYVSAEPLPRSEVPLPLQPWVEWVLMDEKDASCPFVQAKADHRQCVWPSRLQLELGHKQGSFLQEWLLYREAWVPLPGDAKLWPQAVHVGETPAVAVARNGVPSVRLDPGRHLVRGSFRWPALPVLLKIPAETGLLSLSLRGKPVAFPNRDLQGRLWLQKPIEEGAEESRLDVTVHRRVIDEVPLRLESQIELKVSGKNREVLLGRALPEGFVPLSIHARVPARIEPDGRLRVQVRPGTWNLTLVARSEQPIESLSMPRPDGPWSKHEVWVFDARNHLRLVTVEGVLAVDPQQTTIPDAWRQLPAYLIQADSRMQLVEKRRGDAEPAPDQLTLHRTLWLDFDGQGYSLHDQISGRLSQSWRLEMADPVKLGRVAIGGRDRFISRLAKSGLSGVEVRQGDVQIDADSRLPSNRSLIPAVGWNHDFQQVSAQLNLPPGWRLFHTGGVDDVRSTWISRWSLLEIFMVLVTAIAVGHLWGRGWGALALVALSLTYPEAGAPRWSWLALLSAAALLRVVPQGRFRDLVRLYWLVSVVALAAVTVPFMVQQLQQALYPSLEFPWISINSEQAELKQAVLSNEAEIDDYRGRRESRLRGAIDRLESPQSLAPSEPKRRHKYAPDPTARVSTGPGLPHWGWRSVALKWRGPVKHAQTIRLVLIPPWANFLLALSRVALLVVLVLCVLDLGKRLRLGRRGGDGGAAAAVLVALALGSLALPRTASADFPSPELLTELRQRLLEKPECHPECASIPRLRLEVTQDTLRARMQVDAAWETAVPLPGGAKHWLPETVLLNGEPALGIAQSPDGRLWIPLKAGQHQLLLEGPLPERESVQIPLPLKPHRVEAKLEGWVLEGLRDGGLADDNLQLTRVQSTNGVADPTLEPTQLPPFLRVERHLQLGLAWQITTRVVRVSPRGAAVLLEVPLLPGESVTTDGIRVEDGKALVNMAPQVSSLQWTSVLEQVETLTLVAPDSVPWIEVWRLDATPVWHIEAQGIPVIHQPNPGELRIREWRPWPGETVSIAIGRPEGVEGRTFTIDRSALHVNPGLRASDAQLHITLRASRGAQHTIALPQGAELQWVEIDGERQPIHQVEQNVTLPIRPGKHSATLAWRSPGGISAYFATPSIDLRTPSVNSEIQLAMPRDRWVLFLGGPRMGPAVLFWSLLWIALIVAIGLGKLPLTPLRWGSWLLLFIGLTQVPIFVSLIVGSWLIALGWRRDHARPANNTAFDAFQVLLAAWTGVALLGLVWAIQNGLLGLPNMHIMGNGSSAQLLRWYQDRSSETLPSVWVVSVPLAVYRLAILAWALWLARALIGWLRWGWDCFRQGGLWRPLRTPVVEPDWSR